MGVVDWAVKSLSSASSVHTVEYWRKNSYCPRGCSLIWAVQIYFVYSVACLDLQKKLTVRWSRRALVEALTQMSGQFCHQNQQLQHIGYGEGLIDQLLVYDMACQDDHPQGLNQRLELIDVVVKVDFE